VIYDVDRPFYLRPVSKVFITAFSFFNRAMVYTSKLKNSISSLQGTGFTNCKIMSKNIIHDIASMCNVSQNQKAAIDPLAFSYSQSSQNRAPPMNAYPFPVSE